MKPRLAIETAALLAAILLAATIAPVGAETATASAPPGLAANPAAAGPADGGSAKIKVIADQDSAGPHGTNFLSLLMLLNAPQIELLGITTVSGDQWVEPSTFFALHAVELAGRTDVPVVKGAEQPLLRTARTLEIAEELYGSFPQWRGVFNPDTPPPDFTWEPPGGYPKTEPHPGRAAEFIIETVRAHPGEVVLYFAGPMTNLALAVRMDPGIVELVKTLYIMGPNHLGGPDFNWWWDPEAAAIVMREPWREVFISTVGIGFEVPSSESLMRRVVEAGGPFTDHIRELYLDYEPIPGLVVWSAMWDELTVAAMIDPSVITHSEEMWLDVDITHGPKYGHTIVWKRPGEGQPSFFMPYSGPGPIDRAQWESHLEPPVHLQHASVQMEVDVERFEEIFVELMSHQPSDR